MAQFKKSINRICFAAGHSGGHIIPCLTLAQHHKRTNSCASVLFFTSSKLLDQHMIKTNSHVDQHVAFSLTQKRSAHHLLLLTVQLVWATLRTFFLLFFHRPTRIISTGSTVALPVLIVGWLLRIPIDLYELNAVPGKTIKLLAPLATHLYVCFATAQHHFNRVTIRAPYPIRFEDTISGHVPIPQFSQDKLTLLVLGGSQGSREINILVKQLIESYPTIAHRLQIIHQTGNTPYIDWTAFYTKYAIPAHAFSYDQEMAAYYEQADLIISRAGAGILFEALYFKKSCIIIPLEPTWNPHQLHNANAMAQEHPDLFTVIRHTEQTAAKLHERILLVLNSHKKHPLPQKADIEKGAD